MKMISSYPQAKLYSIECGPVQFPVTEFNGYKFAPAFYEGFDHSKMTEHMAALKDLEIRDDDVILLTYPKSGTHLVREICHMLQVGRIEYISAEFDFPIEYRRASEIASLKSPRTIHSHVWYDMLPQQIIEQRRGKVIAIFRNPKDVIVSFWHFLMKRFQVELPIKEFTTHLISGEGICDSWYEWRRYLVQGRRRDNEFQVLPLQFEEIIQNPQKEISKIAKFLGKSVTTDFICEISKVCEISTMREAKLKQLPKDVGNMFKDGYAAFYRKGTHLLKEVIHMLQVGRIEYMSSDIPNFPLEYRDLNEIASLKSPRMIYSHLWYSMLPKQLTKEHRGKIIALIRNPKDTLVSFWHFTNTLEQQQLPLDDFVDLFIKGDCM
ncbi:hypothetical protein FSP39_012295 [Pinctada imbricata]|uniref:Sulfotransferase domain-containing protein n=1 Tax=Pinctada imbricata TaxID=66713 RepID=A0AA89CAT1_PINIB|nr:hypothetical protein FSP39_012295 [Pinctada imbricata]